MATFHCTLLSGHYTLYYSTHLVWAFAAILLFYALQCSLYHTGLFLLFFDSTYYTILSALVLCLTVYIVASLFTVLFASHFFIPSSTLFIAFLYFNAFFYSLNHILSSMASFFSLLFRIVECVLDVAYFLLTVLCSRHCSVLLSLYTVLCVMCYYCVLWFDSVDRAVHIRRLVTWF